MYRLFSVFLFLGAAASYADDGISFRVAGRQYQLAGGHAVVTQKNGKTQLVIAVKDINAKAMFAITAEVPAGALDTPQELSAEYNALTLVIMNTKGVYSIAPHTTLARDDFMRYQTRQEVETGELEDDPNDHPEERIDECRHNRRLSELCERLMRAKRLKRKKIRVEYKKHGPTWVNKTRQQRIDSGDGVMREAKYRDTAFVLRINPTKVDGKLTHLKGSFAGVIIYNEGLSSALKTPIQNGQFSLQVKNVP